MSVCAVCVLQSRVAVLTMIASTACAATLVRPRVGFACGFVILAVALLVDGFLGFPLAAKFGRIWDARISLWLTAWAMFLDAPWLGHGPHTFALLYTSYLHGLNLPAWLPRDPHLMVPWAHNLYLEVLAGQGIIGLAAFVGLLGCGVSAAWKLQRAAGDEVRIFSAAALAGLVGLSVAAAFELTLSRQWVTVMFFTLLGVIAQLSVSRAKVWRENNGLYPSQCENTGNNNARPRV